MKWKAGKQFEKAPAGSHIARCYMVVDLGTQPKSFQGITHYERQVRIAFELPNEKMAGVYDPNSKGRVFSIGANYKQSLHPKANLRKLLAGWRGRDFKDGAEIEAFDPKKLPGLPCRINIVHSADGQYANIDSVSPLGRGEKCPKAVNKAVFLSLDPDEFNLEVFESLYEGLREKIANSPEFKKLDDPSSGGESQPDAPEQADTTENDDDVPF